VGHEALGTTEGDGADVFDMLPLHERKRGITPDDLLEQHLKLQPGQGRTGVSVSSESARRPVVHRKVPTLARSHRAALIRDYSPNPTRRRGSCIPS
jgi:hypothetical protein